MTPEDYGRFLATKFEEDRNVWGRDLTDQTDRVLACGVTGMESHDFEIRLENGQLVRRDWYYVDNPKPEIIDGKSATGLLGGQVYPELTDYEFLTLVATKGAHAPKLFPWAQGPKWQH